MLIFPGRRVSGLHGIHCARSSPPVRLQQCCLSFFFVIVFHRVGQGRFLIRVNHDNSVENAKYRGLGLLLPSLLKQIEDLFFFIFILFYTFHSAGLCCTHCSDSYGLEFGAFLERFSQCLLHRLISEIYRLQVLCT